jgi:membrane-bound ClpP family serine protease
MEQKPSLFSVLFGNPATTTLENRIFNVVMLLSFVTALTSMTCDIIYQAPLLRVFLSILPAGITLTIYLYSLKMKKYEFVALPIIIAFILILAASWFSYQGMNGATPYYFIIFVLATNIILKRSQKIYGLAAILGVVALLICIEIFFPNLYVDTEYSQRKLDITTAFFLCMCIIVSMTSIVLVEHEKDKERLKKAHDEINELRKFIPICAGCKRIRDEKGGWKRLEEYFSANSEIEFTHSLCPECLAKNIREAAEG